MLEILPNPDNVPGAVTTGYQRQNTNFFAIQTGIDTTEPYDNSQGTITIPLGGIVEVNGSLYKITSDITLTKPNINTAYWIAIKTNTDGTAVARLVTRPGNWDSAKKACYTTDNERVLNWFSIGSLEDTENNLPLIYSNNLKGKYDVQLPLGFYYVQLRSGLGADIKNNLQQRLPTKYNEIDFIYFNNSLNSKKLKIGGNGYPGYINNYFFNDSLFYDGTCGGGEETSFDGFTTGSVSHGRLVLDNGDDTYYMRVKSVELTLSIVKRGRFGIRGNGYDGGYGGNGSRGDMPKDAAEATVSVQSAQPGSYYNIPALTVFTEAFVIDGAFGGDGGSTRPDGSNEAGACEIRRII